VGEAVLELDAQVRAGTEGEPAQGESEVRSCQAGSEEGLREEACQAVEREECVCGVAGVANIQAQAPRTEASAGQGPSSGGTSSRVGPSSVSCSATESQGAARTPASATHVATEGRSTEASEAKVEEVEEGRQEAKRPRQEEDEAAAAYAPRTSSASSPSQAVGAVLVAEVSVAQAQFPEALCGKAQSRVEAVSVAAEGIEG